MGQATAAVPVMNNTSEILLIGWLAIRRLVPQNQ
jgi:hypothetical protein